MAPKAPATQAAAVVAQQSTANANIDIVRKDSTKGDQVLSDRAETVHPQTPSSFQNLDTVADQQVPTGN